MKLKFATTLIDQRPTRIWSTLKADEITVYILNKNKEVLAWAKGANFNEALLAASTTLRDEALQEQYLVDTDFSPDAALDEDPDASVCIHANHSFVAHLSAPGYGQSWKCDDCGEALWAPSAEAPKEAFKDLDHTDYTMSPADVI